MIEISCPHCNARFRIDEKYAGKKATCRACGGWVAIPPVETFVPDDEATLPISPTETSSPEERVFLDERSVKVTSARLVARSQTYAIKDIASVEHTAELAPLAVPLLAAALGFVSIYHGAVALSAPFLIFAALWLVERNDSYNVNLITASGKRRVLASTDKEYISRVVEALNAAIVCRR
jgi:Family of unknown function (DUF6232)